MSRPQARTLKAMGKWTRAGWAGKLLMNLLVCVRAGYFEEWDR